MKKENMLSGHPGVLFPWRRLQHITKPTLGPVFSGKPVKSAVSTQKVLGEYTEDSTTIWGGVSGPSKSSQKAALWAPDVSHAYGVRLSP